MQTSQLSTTPGPTYRRQGNIVGEQFDKRSERDSAINIFGAIPFLEDSGRGGDQGQMEPKGLTIT